MSMRVCKQPSGSAQGTARHPVIDNSSCDELRKKTRYRWVYR